MKSSQVPIARKEGLVIQEMPEEVLVYDLDTNKAHCLNQTAAFVWKSCDGRNSVAEKANTPPKTDAPSKPKTFPMSNHPIPAVTV